MMRTALAAIIGLLVSVSGTLNAQTSTQPNTQTVPPALFKTWQGELCNGRIQVSMTFTGAKGNRLVGTAKDSMGTVAKFDPDDETSHAVVTWDGATVTYETNFSKSVLEFGGGALTGTYTRKNHSANRMNCPPSEQIALR